MKKFIAFIVLLIFVHCEEKQSKDRSREFLLVAAANQQKLGEGVYTSFDRRRLYTQKKGDYTVTFNSGIQQKVALSGNEVKSFLTEIAGVINPDGTIAPLSLLPPAEVDIKVIPHPASVGSIALVCGTNNSLEIEACEKTPQIKELLGYAYSKKMNAHLYRYSLGSSILTKVDKFQALIEGNLAFQIKYEWVIGISQGTQIFNVLLERNKISFKKALKVVAPDTGILKELNQVALDKEKFLFMVSSEYTDFLEGSEFYKRATNQCQVYKSRSDIITVSLNNAKTQTDLLIPVASHKACSNPATTWTYYSEKISHYSMGDDTQYMTQAMIAILEGTATKKDLYDPRDTGIINFLSQLQTYTGGVFGSLSIAPDGHSLISTLTAADGTAVATMTVGDFTEGGKVKIGGIEVGEIQPNGNGVIFTPYPVTLFGMSFTYSQTQNQFSGNVNGKLLVFDLNTGKVLFNGNAVSSFSMIDSLQTKAILLPDFIAGNITVRDVRFNLSTMSLEGIYTNALSKMPVRIDLKTNSIYLDGTFFAKFSDFIEMQLKNVEQSILSEVPISLKPFFDVIKNMRFHYLTIDPKGKLLVSLSYMLDVKNEMNFIFELGLINGKPYLKSVPGVSFITLYPDEKSSIFLSLDEFSIVGGDDPEGILKIKTALKYKTEGSFKSIEIDLGDGKKMKIDNVGKLLNTAILSFLTNPQLMTKKILDLAAGRDISKLDTVDIAFLIKNAWTFWPILGITYLFSSDSVYFDAKADLNGSLALRYKNKILSMPALDLGASAEGKILSKIFFDIIPFVTIGGNGSFSALLSSPDLSKGATLTAKADAAIDAKLLFLTIVGAKAELKDLTANVYFNRSNAESKGNISADIHVVAQVLGIFTWTDQKLKVDLTHLNSVSGKENFKMGIYRDRFDILSSATQSGDIYLSAVNGNVTINSHSVVMTGRANISNNCDGGLVSISGGSGIHIAEKKIECFSEGVIDAGCGRLQLWKTKWFDTSMEALSIGF